jgi:hypothetical protein
MAGIGRIAAYRIARNPILDLLLAGKTTDALVPNPSTRFYTFIRFQLLSVMISCAQQTHQLSTPFKPAEFKLSRISTIGELRDNAKFFGFIQH